MRLDHFGSQTSTRRTVMAGAAVAGGGLVASRFAPGASAQDATPDPAGTPDPDGTPLPQDGVPLDPQMQLIVDKLRSYDAPPVQDVEPFIARNLPNVATATADVLGEMGIPSVEQVGNIDHILIPGPDGNDILARIYTPLDA